MAIQARSRSLITKTHSMTNLHMDSLSLSFSLSLSRDVNRQLSAVLFMVSFKCFPPPPNKNKKHSRRVKLIICLPTALCFLSFLKHMTHTHTLSPSLTISADVFRANRTILPRHRL